MLRGRTGFSRTRLRVDWPTPGWAVLLMGFAWSVYLVQDIIGTLRSRRQVGSGLIPAWCANARCDSPQRCIGREPTVPNSLHPNITSSGRSWLRVTEQGALPAGNGCFSDLHTVSLFVSQCYDRECALCDEVDSEFRITEACSLFREVPLGM